MRGSGQAWGCEQLARSSAEGLWGSWGCTETPPPPGPAGNASALKNGLPPAWLWGGSADPPAEQHFHLSGFGDSSPQHLSPQDERRVPLPKLLSEEPLAHDWVQGDERCSGPSVLMGLM